MGYVATKEDIFRAVKEGDKKAIRDIAQEYPDAINAEDDHGRTPIHFAAEMEDAEIMETVIDCGAEINARDCFKRTPLHIAVNGNRIEVAKVLLRSGVDRNAQDNNGRTAVDLAKLSGYGDMLLCLE